MVMANQAAKVRRFQIERSWIRWAKIGAGVVVVGVPLFLFDYVRLRSDAGEIERLRHETSSQREELKEYGGWMQQISERLSQVAQLDKKLRVITSLDPVDPVALPGVGGQEGEGFEPIQLSALTRRQRRQQMLDGLKRLEEAAQMQGRRLEDLLAHLEDQTARLAATPSISPTRGWITSDFGYRNSPFTGTREYHRGLDIAGRPGTPIIAPADGRVRHVGDHRNLGKTVIIRHGYGVETVYSHLSTVSVKIGDPVKRGQEVAAMGNTGRSTGPHLHYQVQVNGAPVNPRNYMLD
jgi:murein DD-endopeptidase MepM/ murein hydrolase activator NlpD